MQLDVGFYLACYITSLVYATITCYPHHPFPRRSNGHDELQYHT